MAPRIFPAPLRQGGASEVRERVLQETDGWLHEIDDLLEVSVRPQFSIVEDIDEVDRAVEAGRLGSDAAKRLLGALAAAHSAAEAEDIMLREFYHQSDAA